MRQYKGTERTLLLRDATAIESQAGIWYSAYSVVECKKDYRQCRQGKLYLHAVRYFRTKGWRNCLFDLHSEDLICQCRGHFRRHFKMYPSPAQKAFVEGRFYPAIP